MHVLNLYVAAIGMLFCLTQFWLSRRHLGVGGNAPLNSDGTPGGKAGVVVRETPAYPFPDAHAHGVEAADEPTYDVAFRTEDLWPQDSDPALVHVGVFQSYLQGEP